MEPKEELKHDLPANIRAIAAVGTHVWCGLANGDIHVWDGTDGEPLHVIPAHPGAGVAALFYSERNNMVWSGGNDGRVCVWSAPGKQCLRRLGKHASAVRIIVQVGAHVWTIADSEAGAFLWEADTHYHVNGVGSHANGHANGRPKSMSPIPLAASPPPIPIDGEVTEGSAPAGVVYLGAGVVCLLCVLPHETTTNSVLLWAGSIDGSIKIFDAETKEVLLSIKSNQK
jgi:WD40 repeat protein